MSLNEQAVQQLEFLIANTVNDALTLGLSDDLGANVIHVDSSIPQFFNLSITNTLIKESKRRLGATPIAFVAS